MSHHRSFNFSAGPAVLPEPVLQKIQEQIFDFKGSGMSVMEMSHRSKEFDEIIANAEKKTRELLKISDDYAVLFLQGGASLQFSMAPMNLAPIEKNQKIEVLHTGYWTEMALGQLKKGFQHSILASGEKDGFKKLPLMPDLTRLDPEKTAYVHMCSNNTIEGTQWKSFPDSGKTPVVADMSSDILSRFFDINKFGLVYAGAQKNLGPSGMVLAIIRKDLSERANETLPTMLQYRTHIKAGSRYNTPPAFGIYVYGLVLEWIEQQGGLDAIEKINAKKANHLYEAIDSSQIFHSPIEKNDRSKMNVVFRIGKPSPKEELEELFLKEAKKAGLNELKGHRAIGGLRASIYNAQPMKAVEALVSFMKDFEKKL